MDSQTAAILEQASAHWQLPKASQFTLLADRENKVFRIDIPSEAPSVLRIHRADYHSDAALKSELLWMQYLSAQGMSVPVPMATPDGSLWLRLAGHQVDRMSWLSGRPFGESGKPCLPQQVATLDYGLIHADILRENVLLQGCDPVLLDFDDAGFGFRLFELATTLLKTRSEPDYAELEAALIRGYTDVRPLDTTLLSQFILLRALTYVGWIVPRLHEPGAEQRCTMQIQQAVTLAERFLEA